MNNALALSIPFPSMAGSLDTYIQAVNRFPLLTQEEETVLARRLRDDEDVDACQRRARSHAGGRLADAVLLAPG